MKYVTIYNKREYGFTLTEITVVFTIIILVILILTPFINNIRTNAKLLGCKKNMQEISLALKLYANEHEGNFPPTLGALLEKSYVENERVFDCPGNSRIGSREEPDYQYTTGYTKLSPSDEPIVFDKLENHKNGRNVLYIDGNIAWKDTNGAMAE